MFTPFSGQGQLMLTYAASFFKGQELKSDNEKAHEARKATYRNLKERNDKAASKTMASSKGFMA